MQNSKQDSDDFFSQVEIILLDIIFVIQGHCKVKKFNLNTLSYDDVDDDDDDDDIGLSASKTSSSMWHSSFSFSLFFEICNPDFFLKLVFLDI